MSLLSQRPETAPARNVTPRQTLVIVCAGVVMASLDLFIVNVALPQIARDLHEESLGTLSWVLNGYAIIYAALLVLAGRLADRHNRKNGFLLGVAIFTAGSAACGAAATVPMLIAFRLVQAAGAALLTPTSLGLVLASYSAERRGGAVRAWTAAGGMAASLGPALGGLLVAASWRWVFLVNVPIGLAAIVAGWRRLPDVPGHAGPRPDELSAVLVTAGVGALTLGLVRGGAWGWTSAATVGVLAGAVIVLVLFVARCLHHHNPLIEPALFRVRTFSGASVAMLFFSISFGAMLLSIVLWMQDAWGWSALRTGLGLAPGPLMVPLFTFLVTGRLTGPLRAGPRDRHRHRGVRRGRQLVGGHGPAEPGLPHRAARHAGHGHWRRPDAAVADVHGRVLVAAAVVRDRLRRGEHAASGRVRGRGGDAGRRARQPGRAGRGADRVPARLVGDRGRGPGGDGVGDLAAGPPRPRLTRPAPQPRPAATRRRPAAARASSR